MKRIIILLLSMVLLILPVYATETTSSEPPPEDNNGGLIQGLLDGIKGLFIPSDDFFASFKDDIMNAIDQKTGGLSSAFSNINDKFKHLSNCDCKTNSLDIAFKDDHFFKGYKGISVNILGSADNAFKWLKGLISGVLVIFTVFICYRKTINLFKN